ncbi:hypothetical protein CW670_07535 [Macrococcoides caseolyticum]|uniref:hypothetical protein n=1 Tax=Macrococcoides TaxID=3076173 RepID=UPI000C342D5F|nr:MULTISPECIES: hypothetical protein [Macrococcus]MBC9873855.1 hypothetical protein [Macrococcus bohemicus]PKE35788.1 hypothetical protein CW695_06845 [Macrococcus caseolyticus]PKE74389.1 hypothetical protein CW670_07535 [Macrococcus caseolyticus]
MTQAIVVNKYSELEIKKMLLNIEDCNLNEEQQLIRNDYIRRPKLNIKNMNIIAEILNIDVDEMLDTQVISPESLHFRNKKNSESDENLHAILMLMVKASRQLELNGEIV